VSYDIRLLLVKDGESVLDVAYRDEIADEPYTSERRARNLKIVEALEAAYPELDRFESDHHFELTDLKGGTGLQVSLFGSSGAVTLPYWHQHDADRVLKQVDDILRIILENSPFVAFDPQTEQELTAKGGVSATAKPAYAFGVAATKKIGKNPWWRFWQ
jgi:hypothetical protein